MTNRGMSVSVPRIIHHSHSYLKHRIINFYRVKKGERKRECVREREIERERKRLREKIKNKS